MKQTNYKIVQLPMRNEHEQFSYLIADPFNRGFNPAKLRAGSKEEEDYKSAFKTAFEKLQNGEFFANLPTYDL